MPSVPDVCLLDQLQEAVVSRLTGGSLSLSLSVSAWEIS